MTVGERTKAPVRRPDLDTMLSVNPDGSRNAIHPADVAGRFQRKKHALWYLLLAIYLAVPWLRIDGQPVLLFQITERHFFLLGRAFDAQDFWLAFFFLAGFGLVLFAVAALFGRLWCGYACPQTVFLEGVFRRIERWIEGPAPARARLDRAPMSPSKLLRRGAKLGVFFAIAAVIAHALLGYFMPVEVVVEAMTSPPERHPAAFTFASLATLLLFVNFAWFREQTCIALCPYGRLQGALYDADTLLVGYDQKRGEPRGPVTAGATGATGDCVDCFRCVAVCPTGIDIRNGTQMECVGCANCIDACDAVMAKLGRPRGLVRYDTPRGFETGRRRFLRPRVFLYTALLLLAGVVFALSAAARTPFEAALQRRSGAAFTLAEGRVGNDFDLQVVNKLAGERLFRVEVVGPQGADVGVERTELHIGPLQTAKVAVHVAMPREDFRPGMQVELAVRTVDGDRELVRPVTARVLGPTGSARQGR